MFKLIIPQLGRYIAEGIMHKKIRTQTNQIFQKIQLSLNPPTNSDMKTKEVDRRSESRYHTAAK